MISPWIVGVIALVAIAAVVLLGWDARRNALIARTSAETARAHTRAAIAIAEDLRVRHALLYGSRGLDTARVCAQCGWELRWCDVSGCRGRRTAGWRTRSGILS